MPFAPPYDQTALRKMIASLLVLAAIMGAVMGGPHAVHAQYVNGELRGTSVDDWQGWTIMKGGKGYAPSPMGQVHYRDIGPRDDKNPIVLLHQSPMTMIQWAAVQNELADLGVRAITIDTPGYGTSDLPSKQPSIKGYADTVAYVLDHLKLDKVVIAGHHTGAQIAVAFAANHPHRTLAVVLHGVALFTEDEAAEFLAMDRTPRTPRPDGSHLSRTFRPRTPPPSQAMLDAMTLGIMTAYIQGPDIGHWAAYHYNGTDMEDDLMSIQAPGMILTDTKDIIHPWDLKVAKKRPDFEFVEFSDGGSTLEFMMQPRRWATIVTGFLDSIETK